MSHPDSIRCPECKGTRHTVVKTQHIAGKIYRRRLCGGCKSRFTTYEKTTVDPAPEKIDKTLVEQGVQNLKADLGLSGHI